MGLAIIECCRIPWGPAKKNSTRIIVKPNGKRKTIPISTYVAWEISTRLLLSQASKFRYPCIDDVEVNIFAFPPSNRPDIHNQIDGVLDALQCVKKRGLIHQFGAITNDRLVKKVSIEFAHISTQGYLVVWVSKM